MSQKEENELFVEKNLLDKQIIDIKGNKIVRVNDVILQDKPVFSVTGVDIGILGILRRLSLENVLTAFHQFLGIHLTSKFLSWGDIQPLELSRGRVKLKKQQNKLLNLKPEDLADYLEKTTVTNTIKFLDTLNEKLAAQIFNNLNLNYQISLIRYLSFDKAAKIISLIDSDEAVDILLNFSLKRREKILSLLEEKKRRKLLYLIQLAKTPIGGLISDQFITVFPEMTASQIVKVIKKKT